MEYNKLNPGGWLFLSVKTGPSAISGIRGQLGNGWEILALPGFVWSWDEAWEGAGLTPVVGKHPRKRGQGPSMTVGIVKAAPPQPG